MHAKQDIKPPVTKLRPVQGEGRPLNFGADIIARKKRAQLQLLKGGKHGN